MKEKGLCSACVNNSECTFDRKFPVRQCGEFDGEKSRTEKPQDVGEPEPVE